MFSGRAWKAREDFIRAQVGEQIKLPLAGGFCTVIREIDNHAPIRAFYGPSGSRPDFVRLRRLTRPWRRAHSALAYFSVLLSRRHLPLLCEP